MHKKRLLAILILLCILISALAACTQAGSVTITYDSMGGSKIANRAVSSGATEIELPVPEKDGYDFAGWYYDAQYTLPVDKTVIPTKSITIFAKWDIKTVTISLLDEEDEIFQQKNVNYGGSISYGELPAPPVKLGFKGEWRTLTGEAVTSEMLTGIRTAFSLKAYYTVNKVSVAYYVNEADADPTHIYLDVEEAALDGYKLFSYDHGDPAAVTQVPAKPNKEGYYFMGWYFDERHTEKCVSLPETLPYSDLVLYAYFINVSDMNKYLTFETIMQGGQSYYRVTGLTPLGRNQDTIVIPSRVDGKTVISVGRDYTGGSTDDYKVFSGNYLTHVTIPDTVTTIGSFAFADNTKLKTVTIDGGLVSIGTAAFAGCTSLKEIILPDSVTTIGAYAFAGITKTNGQNAVSVNFPYDAGAWTRDEAWYYTEMSLEKLNISTRSVLNNIRPYAFLNTAQLTSINIPNSLTEIDYTMFDGSSLESINVYGGNTDLINVGDAVYSLDRTILFYYPIYGSDAFTLHPNTTSIASRAFYNNKTLINITFNNNLASIGANAFEHAAELENVVINAGSALASIGINAFAYCTKLTSFQFPANINALGEGAFRNCERLTSAVFHGNSLSALPRYAFYGCVLLDNVTLPASVKTIGDYTFYGNSALRTLDMNAGSSLLTSIGAYSFAECVNLEPFTLPYDLAAIGDYAFASENGTMKVEVELNSTKLTRLGAYAFKNCAGMSRASLPNTITDLGEGAFMNCTGMTNVSLLGATLLTEIPARLFYNCPQIRNTIIFPNNFTKIGDYAFYNCSSLTEITFNNIRDIGKSAFENCSNLREGANANQFILPTNLDTLGERAFANCVRLTSIHIPNTLLAISKEAFLNCSMLTAITYNSGTILETLGENSFAYCTSLASFEIPATLKTRGVNTGFIKNPFFGCSALTAFVSHTANLNNLVVINDIIFEKTTSFEEMQLYSIYAYPTGKGSAYEIATNVSEIGDYAFYGSAIPALTFTAATPEGVRELLTLVKVGKYAFANCDRLTSVSLSKRVYELDEYAFYNCRALNELSIDPTYAADGGVTQTGGIYYEVTNKGVNAGNDNLLTIGDYAFAKAAITELTVVPRVININSGAFSDCYSLLTLTFIDSFDTNLLTIGDYAFYANNGLTSLELPVHLEAIGEYAFAYCVNIRDINFKTSVNANGGNQLVLDIGAYAFSNTHFLYTLSLPSSLNSMGEGVFSYASRLKYVNFAPALNLGRTSVEIPARAFSGDKVIEKITIPAYVTLIGDHAFDGLMLDEIVFLSNGAGDEDLVIGDYAFANLSRLTSIALPDRLTGVGNYAFANSNISALTYSPDGRNFTAGDGAFANIRIKEFTVKPRITSLGKYAFAENALLERVIYEGHTDLVIDEGTFRNSAIREVRSNLVPATAFIGMRAFENTPNLTVVSLSGNGMTLEASGAVIIGDYAFYRSAIGAVSLKSGELTIGDYAFSETKLKTFSIIEATLVSVGELAFARNTLLTALSINASVKVDYLGYGFAAFNTALTAIAVNDPSYTYQVTDGVVYYGTTLLMYPAGKVGATYMAENGLFFATQTDPGDLSENYGIYYIRDGLSYVRLESAPGAWIPNTYYTKAIKTIAPYAFAGNTHLRNLILDAGTAVISRHSTSFAETSQGLTFFTPAELVNSYINQWAVNNVSNISVDLNGMVLKQLIGDRYSLEKYTGTETELTINSRIVDGEKTYNIVSIANEAFNQNISIQKVVLGAGIETIGKYAFADCTALTEFVCGAMLQTIDAYAFKNCVNLTTVLFNDGLKTISKFAFENCSSLDNVVLPDSVTTLGQYAFANCTSLSDIVLGANLTTIMDNCFENCVNLVSISIPTRVAEINAYAFAGCEKLSFVYIDTPTVPGLKKNGFARTLDGMRILVPQRLLANYVSAVNWRDYSDKMLPVEYVCDVEGYENYIIERISGNSYRLVGYLGNESNLTIDSVISSDIIITEIGSYAINHFATSVTLSEGIVKLNDYAFYNAKSLVEVLLPSTLQGIGNYAFADVSTLTSAVVNDYVNGQFVTPVLKTIGNYAFYNTSLTSVVFPQKVTSIGNYAFGSSGTGLLSEITFLMTDPQNQSAPFDMLKIGSYAFINNIYLTSVTFNCFVESLGAGAFNNCTSLRSVYFNSIRVNPTDGKATKTTTQTAFDSCENLSVFVPRLETLNSFKQSWQNDRDQARLLLSSNVVRDVNNSVIYEYESGHRVAVDTYNYFVLEIPTGSTSIAYIKNYIGEYTGRYVDPDHAQTGDPKDTDIVIPARVIIGSNTYTITQISAYAFNNKITSVVIPNTVTVISGYAFYNATSLRSVTFSDNSTLESINTSAFANCTSLVSFRVPKSVTQIGDYAFANCTSLNNLSFEEFGQSDIRSNLYVGNYVFDNCTALTTVTISKHTLELGVGVFRNASKLASVLFDTDASELKTIREYAFQRTALTTITFPKSLEGVGDYAFDTCLNLNSVYITKSVGQPTNTNNNVFNNIPNPFIRVYVPQQSYDVYRPLAGWRSRSILADQKDDTNTFNYILSGAVGNETATITNYLGTSTTLTIPSELRINGVSYRVTAINQYAGNTKITKVEFTGTSYLSTLSSYAFANCTSLREIHLPDTITVMGEYAFSGCTSLTDITLPRGISTIANRTFYNCTSLKEITLPSNVTQIGEAAFAMCTRLNRVIVEMSGSSVSTLGTGAFAGVGSHLIIVVPTESKTNFLNEWYEYEDVIYARNEMYGDYIIKEYADSVAIVQYNGYTDNINYNEITIKGKRVDEVYEDAYVDESLTYIFDR